MSDAREMGIEELKHLATILLGAACADGTNQQEESEAIVEILGEQLGGRELPQEVLQHLMAFDLAKLDLRASCLALDTRTPEQRRWLLKLIARVTEADEVHDFDESAYIVRVAGHIGASREEYEGLTVDVSYDEPPPIPDDSAR